MVHSVNNFVRSELPALKSDMAEVEIGKRRKMWQKLRSILYNSTNALTLTSKNTTKPEPQTQVYKNIMLLHWVWFEPFFIESYCSILAWCLKSICDGLSRLLSGIIYRDSVIYFLRILRCTIYSMSIYELHSNTSSGSAHSKSKSQTKNKPLKQEGKNKQNNLEVACWNHPNLIPHAVPLFMSSQFCKDLIRHTLRTSETISIFKDQRFDSMLKWFNSLIQICSNRHIQQEDPAAFFPLRHILVQRTLAMIANPTQQSVTLQECHCHFFHQGSVKLIQKAFKFAARNSSTHCSLQLLATCLSIHLSGHQVWCSYAATFQPPC